MPASFRFPLPSPAIRGRLYRVLKKTQNAVWLIKKPGILGFLLTKHVLDAFRKTSLYPKFNKKPPKSRGVFLLNASFADQGPWVFFIKHPVCEPKNAGARRRLAQQGWVGVESARAAGVLSVCRGLCLWVTVCPCRTACLSVSGCVSQCASDSASVRVRATMSVSLCQSHCRSQSLSVCVAA